MQIISAMYIGTNGNGHAGHNGSREQTPVSFIVMNSQLPTSTMRTDSGLVHRLAGWITALAGLYFYLWFAVDVPQLFHDRQRAFLWGADFLGTFLSYSGGPVEYVHSLLMQYFSNKWSGIAVLTGLFAATYAGARCLIANYSERTPRFIPLIPAVLGLVLVNSSMTLVPIISLTISVYASCLYVRLPVQNAVARLVLFLVGAAILYYVVSGAFLLVVFLGGLHEFVSRRRLLACAALLLGVLVPVVMRYWMYEPELLALYLRNAPLEEKTKAIDAVSVLLYLAMWMSCPAAILAAVAGRSEWGQRLKKPALSLLLQHKAVRLVVIVIAAGILAVPPILRARNVHWTVVERLVDAGKWEEALACVCRLPEENVIISHMANRALFHTGRLLDDMFRYPQYAGGQALLLDGKDLDALPRTFDKRSILYLELGMISRAERWTIEAITTMGELPALAKRMIAINMVKGRPEAAEAYLGAVKKMPHNRAWAVEYERRLRADPLLEHDAKIQSLRKSMLKVDYVDTLIPEELLDLCLNINPSNRMAFEYLMAHYLLTRRAGNLADNIGLLDRFGYNRIPRHWEEAILSHSRKTGRMPKPLGTRSINPETASRFDRFLAVAAMNQSDPDKMREALRKDFGDTYWFFEMYGRSGAACEPDRRK